MLVDFIAAGLGKARYIYAKWPQLKAQIVLDGK